MPWPGHAYVEFGGRRSASTGEIWQCGIRQAKREEDGETVPYGDELFDDVTLESLVVDQFAFVVHRWFTRSESCISPSCLLDWVSCKWITPSGNPDPEHSYRHDYRDPAPYIPPGPHHGGGSPGIVHPFQSAVVITFTSKERTRGPGSHGRIFSPAPTVVIDPETGLFSSDQAEQITMAASSLVYWLNFGNVPTFDRRISCIVSPSGPGLRSGIDHVSVDTRVDVLRKRADHQGPRRYLHTIDWGILGGEDT